MGSMVWLAKLGFGIFVALVIHLLVTRGHLNGRGLFYPNRAIEWLDTGDRP